ncbi:MAG: RluA family pseudouridine synthase [Deltaproteobacteria bacterium]|nr:RluA family pseudouridine synthase [Deltaproteobacteria bacterium]
MSAETVFTIIADKLDSGERLDVTVTHHVTDCSRSQSARMIKMGNITVLGLSKKPGYRVLDGDIIHIRFPSPAKISCEPEDIPIEILYEDDQLIVVNKQPGIVVHPAPGHYSGTLVNGLLNHCPFLEGIGGEMRPGIVHRLDKDTSGALVVAKNDKAHQNLSAQFKSRQVKKIYLALVHGEIKDESGKIMLPIGRHPVDRKRMSTHSRHARDARTLWKVRERFPGLTLLEVDLKTGRTHQIRVHCAAMGHCVVGDAVYCGRRKNKSAGISMAGDTLKKIQDASRQMLHARHLGFTHPASGQWMHFEAPVAQDMAQLLAALRLEEKDKPL